jgi:hypothetical protein
MDRMKNMMGGLNVADVQKYVQGIDFPIGKDDLVGALQNNGAPSDLVSKIQGASKNRFGSLQDVISSVTGS